jgi:hypothetical protein
VQPAPSNPHAGIKQIETDRTKNHEVSEEHKTAFAEFFGGGALGKDARESPFKTRGVIVLHSDLIESLTDGWTSLRQIVGHNRPYKARRWINACDTDAAQAIMQIFAQYSNTIPKLIFNYETRPEDTSSVPFEITLGGFGKKTRDEVKEFGKGWAAYKEMKDCGDVLTLHENCGQSERLSMSKTNGPFRFVLPIRWGNGVTYMRRFEEVLARSTRDRDFIRDYALILRNTETLPTRKVHFYLCGFTEVGTAAAGYFLAANWPQLWKEHVKDQATGPSRGDFCIVIEGPSGNLRDLDRGWDQVLKITPQSLKDQDFGDDCEWAKRMPKTLGTGRP